MWISPSNEPDGIHSSTTHSLDLYGIDHHFHDVDVEPPRMKGKKATSSDWRGFVYSNLDKLASYPSDQIRHIESFYVLTSALALSVLVWAVLQMSGHRYRRDAVPD